MPWKRTPSRGVIEHKRQLRRYKLRMLLAGLAVGLLAALLIGGLIYFFNVRKH